MNNKIIGKDALNKILILLKNYIDNKTNSNEALELISIDVSILKEQLNTILNGDTSAIDKWEEVENFLQGITDTETLTGLLFELSNELKDYTDSKFVEFDSNGHEYVDMGEAGIWAKYPIGVTNWETCYDDVLYFTWGGIEGYKASEVENGSVVFNGDLDRFCGTPGFEYQGWNGSQYGATKYCPNPDFGKDGFTDNLTVLEPEDDAAHVNMGGSWRMPLKEELKKLYDLCKWNWVTNYNGVSELNGRIFTLKSDNSKQLFIPAAGDCYSSSVSGVGSNGGFWSSSLDESDPCSGFSLYFSSVNVYPQSNLYLRYSGLCVVGFIPPAEPNTTKFLTKKEAAETYASKEELDNKYGKIKIFDKQGYTSVVPQYDAGGDGSFTIKEEDGIKFTTLTSGSHPSGVGIGVNYDVVATNDYVDSKASTKYFSVTNGVLDNPEEVNSYIANNIKGNPIPDWFSVGLIIDGYRIKLGDYKYQYPGYQAIEAKSATGYHPVFNNQEFKYGYYRIVLREQGSTGVYFDELPYIKAGSSLFGINTDSNGISIIEGTNVSVRGRNGIKTVGGVDTLYIEPDKESPVFSVTLNSGGIPVHPDEHISVLGKDGIITSHEGTTDTIHIAPNTEILATNKSVDDKLAQLKSDILGDDLETTFDTLKAVQDWADEHGTEYAELVETIASLQLTIEKQEATINSLKSMQEWLETKVTLLVSLVQDLLDNKADKSISTDEGNVSIIYGIEHE